MSSENLIIGLKKQLQKILFNQQQLLSNLEVNNLVPEHDENNPLVFDSKTVPEMKKVLQGEYIKLEDFEVVLAVVGTMKAGKSTTINAIVGREILPNRNRAMTSLPTLIAHEPNQKEPLLTCDVDVINKYIAKLKKINLNQYADDERVTSYHEIVALISKITKGYKLNNINKGEEAIYNFLADLNDLVRLSRIIVDNHPDLKFPFNAYKEIKSLPRISIEFTELAKQDNQLGKLVLLDTPGPDEADVPELQLILNAQLKRSSAVMLIMDYGKLKGQADANIRNDLKKLPKIEKDRLFAIVNQFDRKDAHGDSEESTKEIVVKDLLKDQVKIENVYCISALNAFLANTVLTIINKDKSKPQYDNKRIQDFAKKAFGESEAEEDWEDASLDKVQKRALKMIENSFIRIPLQNIIYESYKNSPKIAMQSALNDVNYIFNEIKNVFSIKGRFTQAVELNKVELENIRKTINQLEQDIFKLKKNTELAKEELDVISNQSVEEFSSLFAVMEEKVVKDIWHAIGLTIWNFKDKKKQEKEEHEAWFTINKSYREEQKAFDKELKDLENTLSELYGSGKIILREDQMQSLNNIIMDKSVEVNNKIETNIKFILDEVSVKINSEILEVNEKILNDMRKIEETFGREKMEIKFSKLSLNDIKLNGSISLDLLKISNINIKSTWVTKSKVARFFGRIFGKDDWGREEKKEKYYDFTLPELKEILQGLSMDAILKPLKKQVAENLSVFIDEMESDAMIVENQAGKLINELKFALEAEKLPYEAKKKYKESLKLIDLENKNIQKDISLVEKNLNRVLGKVA
ncbi:dynamin family protein [Acinetobacter bereziniae]|uniref:dynamin family protein n=1 Tax=Acinetobacter bereziniae TaxID=106648 RepID=UPI00300A30E6